MILDDGSQITAHCANPGAMTGLCAPTSTCFLSSSDNKKRKLPYSWELVQTETGLVCVNTMQANKIINQALAAKIIPPFRDIEAFQSEVPYGEKSRIDFLLTHADKTQTYLEIKSVTLSRTSGLAEFPDSVTQRGSKHLNELANMVTKGHKAAILYLIVRQDCHQFAIAGDIDPAYHAASQHAADTGVDFYAMDCQLSTAAIKLGKILPIVASD